MMSEKRRLLFLQRCYDPDMSASGEMLRQLGEFLSAAGWEIHVVCAGSHPPAASRRSNSLHIHRTHLIPYWRGHTVARFLSMLRISGAMQSVARRCPRPDIVISLTDPPGMILMGDKLARHHRARHVHWSQDVYPEIAERLGVVSSANPYFQHLKRASTRAMQRADRVVSIGSCMTKAIAARGVPSDKITMIPNWSDPGLKAGNPPPVLNQTLRDALRVPVENLILYSGNLGLAHEFSTVLDCAEVLQHDHQPWNFLFVGGGPRQADVEEAVRVRGLSNIRFLDRLVTEDYSALLSVAALHLVTADPRVDGCMVPSKAYAAFAAGRPMIFIGPPETEIPKTVTRYRAGLSFSNGDHLGLATALKDLALRPEALQGMARSAAMAAQEYSLETNGARFDAVLRSLFDS